MLTPAATTAQCELGEAKDPLRDRLQCLRCGHEFKAEEPTLGLDSEEGWRPLFQKAGTCLALALPVRGTSILSDTVALREGI